MFGHRFDTLLHIWYGMCHTGEMKSGSQVIKLSSCSTQLSINCIMLINVKMPKIFVRLTIESLKAGKPLFQHLSFMSS